MRHQRCVAISGEGTAGRASDCSQREGREAEDEMTAVFEAEADMSSKAITSVIAKTPSSPANQ
jgi:hypothetical protein